MIKKLLIGASALALTTTVAHAQAANQIGASIAQADAVAPVTITTQTQVGARFDNLSAGRPTNATQVTASTDNRHSNFNLTPQPRETPASVFAGIDSSIPTGAKASDLANKATVDQNGSNNLVDIDQAAGQQGFAAVQQDEDGNKAYIVQANTTGANGRLDASASNNLAYIQQQTGIAGSIYGNEARVTQYYTEVLNNITPVYAAPNTVRQPNRAVVLQGENINGHFARDSEATIRQVGAGNDGIIRQGSNSTTSNSIASLQQRGFSNFSAIRQGSESGGGAIRDAAVFQQGELHTANVVQLGNGATTADVVQDGGLRNQANIVQRGSNVTASVLQRNGDFNASYVEQSLGSDGSSATIEQNGGSHNYVELLQSVVNADAKVLQTGGNDNVAVILQSAVANSNAYVDTNGSNNFVTIKQ